MKKIWILITVLSLLMVSVLTGCEDSKKENTVPQQTKSDATEKGQHTTSTDPVKTLTEDEAIQIALDHAELTKDAVTRLHAEYEIDDGEPTWEISFDHERLEYDYEIHAETGKILSYDVDDD